MALDHKQIELCLNEIDGALLGVSERKDCQRFNVNSQLTAVVLLLIRCSSLLRSLLTVFLAGEADSFQVVLRAFEESWYLSHYLRFAENSGRAARWLAGENDSWSADLGALMNFARERGLPNPTMGRDYGRLSEVAHPTKSAAENSVTLCLARRGVDGANAELVEERKNEELRFPDALYRIVWLMVDQDKKFIPLHVKATDVPVCWKFCDGDKHLENAVQDAAPVDINLTSSA
jgi:hypothetical protein